MREIKFRAWDKSKKRFIPIAHIKTDIDNETLTGIKESWNGNNYTRNEIELMQYTGLNELKHLDGKEVYESDIIKNIDTGALQVVYWNIDKGAWYCEYIEDEREDKRIVSLSDSIGNLNEIIGNIHENPELLKNETKSN